MLSSLFFAASLAPSAYAFTQPGAQTWGSLLTPDTSNPVTQGQDFPVTWDPASHPTEGVTVSLVLCHGPGSNCVLQTSAIAEGIPAAQKSFDWKVPCDLAPGTQSTDTGYGMLIIVDGTGEFQYSTQFSVIANAACSGSSSSTSFGSSASTQITTVTASNSPPVTGPPAYGTGSHSSIWGNMTSTVTPTGTVSNSSGVFSFGDSTSTSTTTSNTNLDFPPTTTATASASGQGAATSTGPSGPTFTGGAVQLGSKIARMVVAAAVAVFAM